ncbi:hypothetical protein [Verminephrobacter eiseniae]|nr:hypothetical protein [Verminephrobacter eiseniae]
MARIFCIQLSSSKLAKIGIDPFAQTQKPRDAAVQHPGGWAMDEK